MGDSVAVPTGDQPGFPPDLLAVGGKVALPGCSRPLPAAGPPSVCGPDGEPASQAELSACHTSGPPETRKGLFVCEHLASSSGAIHHLEGGGRRGREGSSPRGDSLVFPWLLAGPKWLLSPERRPVWGRAAGRGWEGGGCSGDRNCVEPAGLSEPPLPPHLGRHGGGVGGGISEEPGGGRGADV